MPYPAGCFLLLLMPHARPAATLCLCSTSSMASLLLAAPIGVAPRRSPS